jgi:hypothetical protein
MLVSFTVPGGGDAAQNSRDAAILLNEVVHHLQWQDYEETSRGLLFGTLYDGTRYEVSL